MLKEIYKKLYLFCWVLYIYTRFVMWTSLSDNAYWLFQSAYILIVIIQVCMITIPYKMKKKQYFLVFILICSGILILLSVRDTVLLITLLFILNSNKVKMREFICFDIKVKFFFVFLTLVLYKIGMLPNYIEKYWTMERGYRYDFGFGNPNVFSLIIFSLLLECIFIANKHKKLILLGGFLVGYAVYKATNSRTSYYTYVISLMLLLTLPLLKKWLKIKWLRFVLIVSPCVIASVSVILVKLYQQKNPNVLEIDKLLSRRLYWANNWLQSYGYTLFGTKLPTRLTIGLRSVCLDMGFIHIPLMYGYLGMFCFLLVYTIVFAKLLEYEQYNLLIYMLGFIIMGVAEKGALTMAYNLPLIFLMKMMLCKNSVIDRLIFSCCKQDKVIKNSV